MSDTSNSILDKIISTQTVSHRDNFKPRETLDKLLALLTERERAVVTRRFGLDGNSLETLDAIGKSFNITRERIRQIERLAVKKLRDSKPAHELIAPIRQVIDETIESEAGAISETRLQKLLAEIGDNARPVTIQFYLNELLNDTIVRVGKEGEIYSMGWRLRNTLLDNLEKILSRAHEIIEEYGRPIDAESLAAKLCQNTLLTPLGEPLLNKDIALKLLELSSNIRKNKFGEWGLIHWQTITPKRMGDKIYLILKKHGKPLHFRNIAELINAQKFDTKIAYPPTVHNELILDKRYVLVGRGMYALREWGYEEGVVAEVLEAVLKNHASPLYRDQLLTEVNKQRIVKKGTVFLALTNRNKFTRLIDGRYTLTAGQKLDNNTTTTTLSS